MFTFEYTYPDYELLIGAIAEKMNTRLKEGWLFIPPEYAKGYIRFIKLPNGLQVNIINFTATTDWFFHRIKSDTEYYTLRFDQITTSGNLEVGIGEDKVERTNQTLAIAYLTSSLNDWHYHATTGTTIKGVNVLVSKEELGQQLGIDVLENILPAYISLKSRSVTMEPLDSYYMELMNEIMAEEPDTAFPDLYVMNRVQLLAERFFSRIRTRVEIADVESKLKTDDITVIMEVEKFMLHDFSKKPPSINQLSRKAAMSATKFKNLFKAVYGTPVYEYYQQKRMQKAAGMLGTGKYSVKEAAASVGYNNTSNFSAAFKKQYKIMPHEYRTS
ncbi:MAG: helix-turn-helix transcriptional regulator [Chitinophagaceae bacterium]|nr:helix-turn-helix transcriptional regulator [Chitinophagaceae bacterium]